MHISQEHSQTDGIVISRMIFKNPGPNVLASGFRAAAHVTTKATWRRRTGRPVRGHAAFLANCCCVLTTATSSSPAGAAPPAPRSSRSRTNAVYTGSPVAAYLRGWSACGCCAVRLVRACVAVSRVSQGASTQPGTVKPELDVLAVQGQQVVAYKV